MALGVGDLERHAIEVMPDIVIEATRRVASIRCGPQLICRSPGWQHYAYEKLKSEVQS